MKYYIALFLLLLSFAGFSQLKPIDNRLVQVTGIITDADSNNVVPYVTVTNLNRNQSVSANYQGYFSFIAHPGDLISFMAVGYKTVQVAVPKEITENKYTMMVKLKPEIVMIQAVRIYPWATAEDFTRAFMAMKIADDDLEIAKKNLSGKSIKALSLTLPRDQGEITSINSRWEHERSLNKNMVQTNPLLNPFAWGRLIQSITKGDKSREADK